MTKQVQRRRGTATQHTSFTGAEGEISVNTTNKSVHVHDGSTAGGIEAARADMTNVTDANLNARLNGNTLSSLTITSADINGGTIDGTVIGGTTAAAITGTALTATSSATLQHSASTKLATTSTGVDVTGTVTADGLTVDGSVGINQSANTDINGLNGIRINDSTGTGYAAIGVVTGDDVRITSGDAGGLGDKAISLRTAEAGVERQRLRVAGNGDISFYEDIGTTPKFFWDASAEALGIGTTSPSADLHISSALPDIRLTDSDDSSEARISYNTAGSNGLIISVDEGNTVASSVMRFHVDGTERLRIDSSGRVGIGTSSPSEDLHIASTLPAIRLQDTDTNAYAEILNNGATLSLRADESNVSATSYMDFRVDGSEAMRIDSSGNVGIGTSSPSAGLELATNVGTAGSSTELMITGNTSGKSSLCLGDSANKYVQHITSDHSDNSLRFHTAATSFGANERLRIDSSGNLLVGKTAPDAASTGFEVVRASGAYIVVTRSGNTTAFFNRTTNDGTLIEFRQDNTAEGTISVSGTTVSYNGGHLSRWSRLPDGTDDSNILKGTVMTNLNEKVVWDGEDNEQLNYTTVSSVEGDKNVAGVFVAWDESDEWGDYYLAMTGDMIIRIAAGTTVERGDLLMSAGDGTAKPQGDDIVRSKTIAKVISTEVTFTYEDGSFCVPCVVMAC